MPSSHHRITIRPAGPLGLSAFAAIATMSVITGCDQSTSSTGPSADLLAREATAKASGALPFGNKFMWWTSYDWKNSGSVAENSDASISFDNQTADDPSVHGGIIKQLDANPGTINTMPGIYTYLVANGVRADLGATDCNVYDSVVVNGVKVRTPTICNVAGGWISRHRDTILHRYKRLAINVQATLGARKNNKRPFIYLLEGDYFQYSSTSQDVYLSPTYLGSLLSDISDTIKKYNPDSRVSLNTSGWYSPDFMAEYFRATRKKNFDFTWINTGFDSDTLDNNWIKSAISTNTWVRRFSGLPVVFEGFGTPTLQKFLARVQAGVVGGRKPSAPSAAQAGFLAAANASSLAKALPASFPDLAPEGVVASVTRAAAGSVKIAFRAWDRDAKIGPATPGQLRQAEVLLNGRSYLVIPGGSSSTNANYSAVVSNLPPSLYRILQIRLTDNDGLVTTLPAVDADSIAIDPLSYGFNLTTDRAFDGKWLATNAVRFRVPDRGPGNQRVRFVLRDSATDRQVASVFSDEMDAAGVNQWAPTWTYAGSIQIPSSVPTGSYRFVMMYNDDNLRTWYKAPFTLRSSYVRFDPNTIFDPYNGAYCRPGFVKSSATGYCAAK